MKYMIILLDQPLVVKNKERLKRTLGIIVPDSYYSRTEEKELPVDLSIVTQSRYEYELSIVLPIIVYVCILGILYNIYYPQSYKAIHLDSTECIVSTYIVLSKEIRNKKGGAVHVGWSTPHIMIIIRSHYQLRQVVLQSQPGPIMIR